MDYKVVLFQVTDMVKDVGEKAFNINPTTVYGFLVMLLILLLVVNGVVIWKMWGYYRDKLTILSNRNAKTIEVKDNIIDSRDEKLIDLNTRTIEVLKDIKAIMIAFQDDARRNYEENMKELAHLNVTIESKIKDLKEDVMREFSKK